jgi:hypothetical protein
MGGRIQIIAFIVGVIFFLSVMRYVKKKNFHPSFSVLWGAVSLFLVSISVLEPFYRWVAYSVIGIIDARHIIYIVLIGFLLVYILFLTSKITRMSDQIQNLISFTAILKNKIDEKSKDKIL